MLPLKPYPERGKSLSVFLFPNRIKDTDFSVTRQVIALLDQHGIHALLADELAGELVDTKAVFLPQQQALAQAKQVITIGGDGTLLRIAHDCLAQSKPVLGVNLGRIGFLATCEVAELPEKLARLAAGRDRKSTRLNSSHYQQSRMPSSA